ncbi:uncharacterized protein Z520_03409 [Fonsecaea multimorphosa CBS 102226]|uniref:AAA+ ATPase domain-containing protein n=1 Tax=Fonsecaea multimorphosa CBS 102226 TaxID=1442371 RepID=A0A0D2KVF6_9EURO|nr:uncharacterized protein Z520_03409 [Fonsecaea multimorphosa CBS 102226]KIY00744.1 hypothetical protein Z520_03409 [Fonsecaea multimorphosa CBS 102226]OAL27789.1 hypothetical protein AYO22_03331 [Fonsecaea multimorphosa]
MSSTFIVRPAGADKDPFRIGLTAVSMLSLKLKSGDICELRGITNDKDKDNNANKRKKLAVAWQGLGPGMKDSIVQTSRLLQEAYGLKLGDKVAISRWSHPMQNSPSVTLQKVGDPSEDADAEDYKAWAKKIAATISPAGEYMVVSQKIQCPPPKSDHGAVQTVEFVVKDVGVPDSLFARVTRDATFRIISSSETLSDQQSMAIVFQPTHLGGLQEQIAQVQDIVSDLCYPVAKQHFQAYEPVQGLLLYGAKGTGKSALIAALADCEWPTVRYWKPGTEIYASTEPCLVIVRPEYLTRSPNTSSTLSSELDSLFQRIRGSPTLVVAEARHPNDIDERLRTEGRFAAEIELPIPSALQRKEILLALRGKDSVPTDDLLQEISERTHGYVGVDLRALLRVTIRFASMHPPPAGAEHDEKTQLVVQHADFETALQQVRPSALQEIFLETPNVRWTDIGGQHEVKRQLHNAVERPLKFADRMKKLRLQPKKGVLLYGPPGCSKTLLVRALATEAGLNFLAVKGAELISMYVGESERATREVFRKARAASPSIIFFDEIDAIASRGRSGSDLNVLTTLLNEMDGFEELRNVFVVAATNKPQNIDPALMRPGRFDNVVYIGPPDLEARKEIFHKRLDGVYESQSSSSSSSLDDDVREFASSTEGFSGAEIVAICQSAGENAFDADREIIVSDDIRRAIGQTPKSITREMLLEFETWNAARMR